MSTVPVSDLGLNSSEQRYLSTVQSQIAASQHSSSSRAASHASSQGRLLLDPSSLQALGAHFDRLMYSIQQRWHYVSDRIRLAELAYADNDGDDDDNDSDSD
jgi:hypothetical protein